MGTISAEYQRAQAKKHPGRAYRYTQKYRKTHPRYQRAVNLQGLYGLTLEQYDHLVIAQGNACAICRDAFKTTPNVDHDHRTRKVRGLLCKTCNRAIGLLKDAPGVLRRAAEYLENV